MSSSDTDRIAAGREADTHVTVETGDGGERLTHHRPIVGGAPPMWQRIYSVWFRHVRVYTRNLVANALPPFLEPLVFLVGIGLGLSQYIPQMRGVPYIEYLASGLMITAAMFTSAFECSFGTYIRLEFDKVYDGMLGSPITANNLLVGEMLWAGTKGFVFSLSVLIITSAFGILPLGRTLVAPVIGFLTGTMFAALGFLVTSLVSNINQFNFFFSGFISPMFFFSGVIFPVENLPTIIRPISEILPLTHPVRIVRGFAMGELSPILLFDLLYMVVVTAGIGAWGIRRLKRRLID